MGKPEFEGNSPSLRTYIEGVAGVGHDEESGEEELTPELQRDEDKMIALVKDIVRLPGYVGTSRLIEEGGDLVTEKGNIRRSSEATEPSRVFVVFQSIRGRLRRSEPIIGRAVSPEDLEAGLSVEMDSEVPPQE